MGYQYSNLAGATTLAADITSGATSLTLASASGLPGTYPFTLILDSDTVAIEVVTVTGPATAGAYPVLRGEDGTVAQAHTAGAKVIHGLVSRDLKGPQDHMAATSNVHGVTGAVVGTTDAQTLSNKTFSGPVQVTNTGATGSSGVAVTRNASGDFAYQAVVSGDSSNRYNMAADGTMRWGPGTSPTDVSLTRTAAGQLTVGGNLAATSLTVAGSVDLGAVATYTPTWTATTTAPVLGNGTLTGTYQQVGKVVTVQIVLTMGSTTTYGSGMYTFSLPVTPRANVSVPFVVVKAGGVRYTGMMWATAANTAANAMRTILSSTTVALGDNAPGSAWSATEQVIISGSYLAN